jgi:hypothetical protein
MNGYFLRFYEYTKLSTFMNTICVSKLAEIPTI